MSYKLAGYRSRESKNYQSHPGCGSEGGCKGPKSDYFQPLDATITQELKSRAPTLQELIGPNQVNSGYKAGMEAYIESRGCISEADFEAERFEAFLYMNKRFGLSKDYTLVPIQTPEGPLEEFLVSKLGLPLSRIVVLIGPEEVVAGWYRPAVFCKNVQVDCFKQRKRCLKFAKASFAEHQFWFNNLLLQGNLQAGNCANQCQAFTLPEQVQPQYYADNFPSLPFAIYGYLTLFNHGCDQEAESTTFQYRSLYQVSDVLSTNFPLQTLPENGELQAIDSFGINCEVKSAELSNNTWAGYMHIYRSWDIRGAATVDLVGGALSVLFQGNGYGRFIQNVNLHLPPTVACCIPGSSAEFDGTFVRN